MKKFLLAMGLALALACTLGLAACNSGRASGGDPAGGEDGKFEQLTTTESVYGFSAASAGMIISAMQGGGASKTFARTMADTGTAQADFSELDHYMALVESLLSDGGFGVQETDSDRTEYTHKMVISWRDLSGDTLAYTMYYNQTSLGNGGRDDDWDDIWDNEQEENYAIDGVLTVEGQDYAVRGSRSVETEGEESESSTQFRVDLGTRTMLVEQESESERGEEEQEYVYSVYEGRSLVERSAFSYESERGETEVKMVSYRGGVSESFYFERETVRGAERILLRVGSGREGQTYLVGVATGADGSPMYTYEPIARN